MRKAKDAGADVKIASFQLRLPQPLYERLIKSANANYRSYNLEIVHALQSYLDSHEALEILMEALRGSMRKQASNSSSEGVVVAISKAAEGCR